MYLFNILFYQLCTLIHIFINSRFLNNMQQVGTYKSLISASKKT